MLGKQMPLFCIAVSIAILTPSVHQAPIAMASALQYFMLLSFHGPTGLAGLFLPGSLAVEAE